MNFYGFYRFNGELLATIKRDTIAEAQEWWKQKYGNGGYDHITQF